MNNALPKTNLIAIEKAITAAADAIALVKRVPAPLKSIADQVMKPQGARNSKFKIHHS
jgi:hypothetical protein